jgi:hypothetical protein
MTDDSGQYDARRFRKGGGIWLPATILVAVVTGAIAWGTNANRLQNAEQQVADNRSESQRIDAHVSADDQRISADEQEIAVLKAKLQYIIEQLQAVNAKLDRAEEERRK